MDDIDEFLYRTEHVGDAISGTARKYETLVTMQEKVAAPSTGTNPLSQLVSQMSTGELIAVLLAIVGLAWK